MATSHMPVVVAALEEGDVAHIVQIMSENRRGWEAHFFADGYDDTTNTYLKTAIAQDLRIVGVVGRFSRTSLDVESRVALNAHSAEVQGYISLMCMNVGIISRSWSLDHLHMLPSELIRRLSRAIAQLGGVHIGDTPHIDLQHFEVKDGPLSPLVERQLLGRAISMSAEYKLPLISLTWSESTVARLLRYGFVVEAWTQVDISDLAQGERCIADVYLLSRDFHGTV